ncbi:MAG: arylsulfatase [Verrucomicrobiae bacterium]|nr:arylsulfatase [Verrucomicrobiae bacterium]
MADDLGYGDLGCYGQELIETPNIDRLATEGIRFTQAYAGGPVCAASRSVLMTGQHNGHTAARDNIPHYPAYLKDSDITLAEVLKSAGYRCGGIGKWSLGDPGTEGRATAQGFDTWFGYLNQDHAHYYYPAYLDDDEGRLELPDNIERHTDYSHDLMTERALKFIRGAKDGPFFFYGAYTIPHFSAKSEDPTTYAVPSDAPYTDRDWDQASKNYAAMITRLDRDVGRILDLLDELGLTKNTLVVFTSDNGALPKAPPRFRSAGPLRGFKSSLYEGGIRVPFLARWPGTITAGSKSDEAIAFYDMLPTFAELSGAKIPENIDGISVVEALKGGRLSKPHAFFYWDYGHCRKRYDQAVRLGNWKGVRNGRDAAIELYDLASDLRETSNVATAHPDVVARIAEILETAAIPSARYPIGEIYRGKPLWQPPGPLARP